MMSYRKHLALSLFWITALPLLAQSTGSPSTPTGTSQAGSQQSKSTTTTAHVAHQRDGQAVFDQNCSRCHTAPQGFFAEYIRLDHSPHEGPRIAQQRG